MNRAEWRLVIPTHIAASREEAFAQCREGAIRFQVEYRERTIGIPRGFECPDERLPEEMVARGNWCIGDPQDLVDLINRLQAQSGGFGGFMLQPVDWATREQIHQCYELVARYVMPRFQGSLEGLQATQADVSRQASRHHELRSRAVSAAESAYESGRGKPS